MMCLRSKFRKRSVAIFDARFVSPAPGKADAQIAKEISEDNDSADVIVLKEDIRRVLDSRHVNFRKIGDAVNRDFSDEIECRSWLKLISDNL